MGVRWKNWLKRVVRYGLIVLALPLVLLSLLLGLLLLASTKQISKNQKVLADLKDRVQAVKEFQRQHERLPNQEELDQLSKALPIRYTNYNYSLSTTPNEEVIGRAKKWPASGGWVLAFWRGEWYDYYSSWDDYYSLADEATWRGFLGPTIYPMLLAPLVAIALVLASRVRFLRETRDPTAIPPLLRPVKGQFWHEVLKPAVRIAAVVVVLGGAGYLFWPKMTLSKEQVLKRLSSDLGLELPSDTVVEHYKWASSVLYIKARMPYTSWLEMATRPPVDLEPTDKTKTDPFSYYKPNSPFAGFDWKNRDDIPEWWAPDKIPAGVWGHYFLREDNGRPRGDVVCHFTRRADGDVDAWFVKSP